MQKVYQKHFPLAQKYAAERGGRFILELFFWPTLLFIVLCIKQYYTFGVVNKVLLFAISSSTFTSLLTSTICYFFYMKNWKRLQVWYFRNQIKKNNERAAFLLDPRLIEMIAINELQHYITQREKEIRRESAEEDVLRPDEYVSSELALLDANKDTLYQQFCDQTRRKGEKHLKKAEKFGQILEEYYGVVQ